MKAKWVLMAMIAWPAVADAQTGKVDEAPFDNACVNVAATYVSSSEDAHVEEMRQLIAICERHPSQSICQETVKMIRSVRNMTPLHCRG